MAISDQAYEALKRFDEAKTPEERAMHFVEAAVEAAWPNDHPNAAELVQKMMAKKLLYESLLEKIKEEGEDIALN